MVVVVRWRLSWTQLNSFFAANIRDNEQNYILYSGARSQMTTVWPFGSSKDKKYKSSDSPRLMSVSAARKYFYDQRKNQKKKQKRDKILIRIFSFLFYLLF